MNDKLLTIERRAELYSENLCISCMWRDVCEKNKEGNRLDCIFVANERQKYEDIANAQKRVDIEKAIDYLVENGFFGCKDSVGAEGLRRHMKGGEE